MGVTLTDAHERHLRENQLRPYRLTPAEFNALRLKQGNACAVCRSRFTRTPHIDHDHATGAVRGLLCGRCNSAFGQLRESPAIIASLLRYARECEKRRPQQSGPLARVFAPVAPEIAAPIIDAFTSR